MLITLCGGEGAGKSTQAARLADWLRQRGRDVVLTREPGGTEIGRKIRALLLDPENRALHPEAELFLYAADRIQHIREVIAPALAAGKIVISDRFSDSTTVYQGVARGLSRELIDGVHQLVLGTLQPDLTFLLDLAPELGLQRAWSDVSKGGRSLAETRFEAETLDFHRRIRDGFLDLAKEMPQRFHIVDAAASPEKMTEEMTRKLAQVLS